MAERKLTSKQEEFAQMIASGSNQSDAYRKAYPPSKKWSNKSIWEASSKLMSNHKVVSRVDELREKYGNELMQNKLADLNEILTLMTNRVRIDPRELYLPDGSFKEMPNLTLEQAQNIAEITTQEIFAGRGDDREQIGRIVKIKLVDLKGIFDSFLKTFGAYIEKHHHTIDDGSLDYMRELMNEHGVK